QLAYPLSWTSKLSRRAKLPPSQPERASTKQKASANRPRSNASPQLRQSSDHRIRREPCPCRDGSTKTHPPLLLRQGLSRWRIAVAPRGASILLEQWRTQIPFADARHDDDDHLPLVLRPLRELGGGGDVAAGADAAEDAFLLVQLAGPLEGLVIRHLNDLIHHLHVQVSRDETGADALDLLPAGLNRLVVHRLRDDRRSDGLDRDRFEGRLARLDHFGDAGERAPRADSGDEHIRRAVGVLPDLFRSRTTVDLGVCGI